MNSRVVVFAIGETVYARNTPIRLDIVSAVADRA
jgi:hypothetical protein